MIISSIDVNSAAASTNAPEDLATKFIAIADYFVRNDRKPYKPSSVKMPPIMNLLEAFVLKIV